MAGRQKRLGVGAHCCSSSASGTWSSSHGGQLSVGLGVSEFDLSAGFPASAMKRGAVWNASWRGPGVLLCAGSQPLGDLREQAGVVDAIWLSGFAEIKCSLDATMLMVCQQDAPYRRVDTSPPCQALSGAWDGHGRVL